ncbi:MAG: amidohydrolase family protein [Rhodospirillales bacterium]
MAFVSPAGKPGPKLKAPPGAVDTHMHFYGDRAKYPWAPTRVNDPPLAWVDDYKAMQKWLGLERVVIVQPSHYAADNRATMDALEARGGKTRAKAVVVVNENNTAREMAELTKRGAVGIRFHMLPGGVLSWDAIAAMAPRVQEHGWHGQLQFNGRELVEREAFIKRLPGTLVFDHVARFMPPVKVDDPAFKAMCRFLDSGRCWMKCSAPYESSLAGPPAYQDTGVLARAFIKRFPERMLWASNWPHPGREPAPGDADLLDLLLDWAPDEKVRRMMLVDNPAKLYGF